MKKIGLVALIAMLTACSVGGSVNAGGGSNGIGLGIGLGTGIRF